MPESDPNPQDLVYIRMADHGPDVLPGRATREAFDTYWADRGFVIVDDFEANVLLSTEPAAPEGSLAEATAYGFPEDLDELTKPQLVELANARGVTVSSTATKAAIIEAIEAAGQVSVDEAV